MKQNRYYKYNSIFRIAFLIVLIVVLIINIILALSFAKSKFSANPVDDLRYYDYAQGFLERGYNLSPKHLPENKYIAPVLPLILAVIFRFFGHSLGIVYITNVAVLFMLSYLSNRIAFKLYGSRKYSSIVWGVSIMYPSYFMWIPTAGKELWTSLLIQMFIFSILLWHTSDNKKRLFHGLVTIPMSYTMMIHLDERYVPLIILFIVDAVYVQRSRVVMYLLGSGIMIVTFCAPWAIQRYSVYGRPVFITERADFVNPFISKGRTANDEILMKQIMVQSSKNLYISPKRLEQIRLGIYDTFDNGIKIEDRQLTAIRNGYYPHKYGPIKKRLMIFTNFWRPVMARKGTYMQDGYRFMNWSLRLRLVNLTYGVFLLLSILNIFLFRSKFRLMTNSFLIYFFIVSVIHVVAIPFANYRYRVHSDFIFIVNGIACLTAISSNISQYIKKVRNVAMTLRLGKLEY